MFPAFPHIYLFLCTIFIFTLSPKWSLPQNLNDNSECFLNRTNTRCLFCGSWCSFFFFYIPLEYINLVLHTTFCFSLERLDKIWTEKVQRNKLCQIKCVRLPFSCNIVCTVYVISCCCFLLDWSNKHLRTFEKEKYLLSCTLTKN